LKLKPKKWGELFQRQQKQGTLVVGFVHQRRLYQVPLPFSRLFGQDVAVESMLPLDFSGTRQLKALFGSRICFHFGHNTLISKSDKI